MPSAEQIPLDVLFEDPWLLAVNKPTGMVVHPSYRNVSGTLLNGILAHRFLTATPGVVTRLDTTRPVPVEFSKKPGVMAKSASTPKI